LEAGPASSGALARDVLGLSRTPKMAAERLALALVGDDPHVTRTDDGRWTLAAQSPSPALEQCRFAVVDVETTGCSPRRGDRVIEIAVVAVADGRVDLVYERLLDPGIPVPPRVTMLTGISSAMVAGQAGFADVSDDLLGVLNGAVFVAHNARFDWAFLTQEFRRSRGLELQGPRLCTVRLARRLLPPMASRALDHVADHFGVEISARHRAAGDAIATAKILQRFVTLAQQGGARTLADLTAHCAPRTKRSQP
jgi:DNA polymerase-3 subunit epsilon